MLRISNIGRIFVLTKGGKDADRANASKMKEKKTHGGKRDGAGRPPATEELKRVTIWINPADMAEIENLGFKKSPFVREAIKEKLAKLKEN